MRSAIRRALVAIVLARWPEGAGSLLRLRLVGAMGHDRHRHYPRCCIPAFAQGLGSLRQDASAFCERVNAAGPGEPAEICYLLDSRGCSRAASTHPSGGGQRSAGRGILRFDSAPGSLPCCRDSSALPTFLSASGQRAQHFFGRALKAHARRGASLSARHRARPLGLRRDLPALARRAPRSRRPDQAERKATTQASRLSSATSAGRRSTPSPTELSAQPAAAAAADLAARLRRALRSYRRGPRARRGPRDDRRAAGAHQRGPCRPAHRARAGAAVRDCGGPVPGRGRRMTELSDELLVAYVDGQLARKQSSAVEKVLAQDDVIARRVKAMKARPSPARSRVRRHSRRGRGRRRLASDPAFAGPVHPLGHAHQRRTCCGRHRLRDWPHLRRVRLAARHAGLRPQRTRVCRPGVCGKPSAGLAEEVARAQALLSRASLEVGLDSQGNRDFVAVQLGRTIGAELPPPDLSRHGFRFTRAQALALRRRAAGAASLSRHARRAARTLRQEGRGNAAPRLQALWRRSPAWPGRKAASPISSPARRTRSLCWNSPTRSGRDAHRRGLATGVRRRRCCRRLTPEWRSTSSAPCAPRACSPRPDSG